MSKLTEYLGFKARANDAVAETTERVETVTEFLSEVAEKLPDILEKAEDASNLLPDLFSSAIEASAPWFTVAVDAAGDAIPPVKAVLGIAKYLTRETNPYALGLLAVSLAYQSALVDAAKELASKPALRDRLAGHKLPKRLPRGAFGEPETPDVFAGFQIDTALNHPLVRRADNALTDVATAAGYPEEIVLALLQGVHERFAETFKKTISDGRVRDKFDPLFRLLELHGREVPTYAFLRRHLDYQLWRFTKAPALGKGGALTLNAPLSQIFTPLDCGVLRWGEIRRESRITSAEGRRRSPFDEGFGGRRPLLETVIDLVGDPSFREAIVVQGTAGAGKSAFTLQLCQALRDKSLRPIRVRMRDLSLDQGVTLMDDLARALTLNCGDDEFNKDNGPCPSAASLDFSRILDETIVFNGVTMSPYVFIFDGWDEISISASEGFRTQIEKTLNAVRYQLLSSRPHRVRVVLTGRPSEDVNEAKFLSEETPVLTVRPFTGLQLRSFVACLSSKRGATLTDTTLPSSSLQRVDELLEQFDNDEEDSERRGRSILGLPLLALLAVWLVLNDENPPDDLIIERSSLYRRLVDLTTRYGGNVEPLGPSANKITGEELRALLQRTAAAMTLRGTEQVSYYELSLRLEAAGLTGPETVIGQAVAENKVPKLMLSFFFNVGQQGCEFIHKTFREYLFAEAVVEALKRNAAKQGVDPPRAKYWQEFSDGDPRQVLAEELGPLLAPQWIQPEVWRHLAWLIGWEVGRSAAPSGLRRSQEESSPLDRHGWEVVRDRLAQLWDWWGEGVHMRAQPYRERGKSNVNYHPPYTLRLAEQIAPVNLPLGTSPEPVRLTTLDAHLGDALIRLNCALHFQINKASGWLKRPSLSGPALAEAIWSGAERSPESGRRYQTRIRQGQNTWWAFAPSSPDGKNHYLENYFARINSAGWYTADRFPTEADFSGADFFGTALRGLVFPGVRFGYARLDRADLMASYFEDCVFASASARESDWPVCTVSGGRLSEGDFQGANFNRCLIRETLPNDEPIAPHFNGAILVQDGEVSRFEANPESLQG
jgi:uncharacterized protein YjbI with pentapeptide repeats